MLTTDGDQPRRAHWSPTDQFVKTEYFNAFWNTNDDYSDAESLYTIELPILTLHQTGKISCKQTRYFSSILSSNK
ncbi:hypothetical protein KIN20_009590 [Parelaphostrongylus tenuis]|uniref:Uncharacterized protein n=1 Tax=Parelaphostrongylus tenuis TaxID=148309 RepID=A0AAD5M8D9_PARTN|nr:hypothetical protein KIN20_009590 [Parelaphostrongylus tenuis]